MLCCSPVNECGKEQTPLAAVIEAFQAPLLRYAARLLNNVTLAQEAPQGVLPSAAPASETAPAKGTAKTERRKVAASVTAQRPPADLMTKPVRLAAALAPTNAVPTNAIPTNAVSPELKQKK